MFKWKDPFLKLKQSCESCSTEFSCEIGLKGCWCGAVKISDQTRKYLRENFKRCLCRNCLEKFESQFAASKEK